MDLGKLSRVVLLEGIEGAGKSTLSQTLVDKGWGSVHYAHIYTDDLVRDWLTGVYKAAEDSKDGRVVIDRLYLSHLVYGPLIRGSIELSEYDLWYLDGWLFGHSDGEVIKILAIHDYDITNSRVSERYGGMISINDIEEGFHRNMYCRQVPVQYVGGGKALLNRLVLEIDRLKLLQYTGDGDDNRFLGTLRPKYWFVSSQGGGDCPGSPFPYKDYGDYLFRAMRVARLRWESCHISPAFTVNGRVNDLYSKYLGLGKPEKVIALGSRVSKLLSKKGIPHETIDAISHCLMYRRLDIMQYASDILDSISEVC